MGVAKTIFILRYEGMNFTGKYFILFIFHQILWVYELEVALRCLTPQEYVKG